MNYKQMPQSTMHVVVKTAANDAQAVAAVRQVLKQADPELPLFDVKIHAGARDELGARP